jgi:hypothetical protein
MFTFYFMKRGGVIEKYNFDKIEDISCFCDFSIIVIRL